jgi:transcriptional regulator with XRE-family HTH domain
MAEQGSAIKRILDRRGIRYGRFCEAVGVPQYAFTRIESGMQRPPDDYYQRAADYFDMPIEDFLKLVDGRPEPEPASVA